MPGRGAFIVCLLVASLAEAATPYRAPRTPSGAPDLQGIWSNQTMTRLERPADFKALALTPAQAAAFEKKRSDGYAEAVAPTDPGAPAPPAGGAVGQDPRQWFGPPAGLARVGREIRSSVIVAPADGKIPFTEAALGASKARDAADDNAFDDIEDRPFDERCLLGAGGGASPPFLNVGTNNLMQIVQAPGHVVLLAENNHDARIVKLGARRHEAAALHPWMGDSVGWWEGDTLVVETVGFSPRERWHSADRNFPIGEHARVVERFRRVAPDTILYAFEVTDPDAYTQTWRGEQPLRAESGRLFEYACHEGNYALPNILAGARARERAAASAAAGGAVAGP